MVPSSYARAAGLQSEINKVTLTRVAGIEMEYNRRLDSYRKEMRMNINILQQEQEKLKQSLAGYSRKFRQDRRERVKRLQKEYESDCRYTRIMLEMDHGEDETEGDQEEEEWEQKGEMNPEEDNSYMNVNSGTLQNTDSPGVNDSSIAVDHLPIIFPVTRYKIQNHYPENKDTWSCNKSMKKNQPRTTDEHVDLKQKLNNRGMQSTSYSNLITSKQDHETTKQSTVETGVMSSEENKKGTINETQNSGHRLPDTRDNVYFRGFHGEVHSSYNLIRTAAIIYPIQYGYENNKDERQIRLPVVLQAKQTTKVGTKAEKYWRMLRQRQIVERGISWKANNYQKMIIKPGNSETQAVSRYDIPMNNDKYWAHSNGQISLPRLAKKVSSLRLGSRKDISSTQQARLSSSLKGKSYLSLGLDRRQTSRNSNTIWKSLFQKLKIVHTLGSLSEVFPKP